MAVYKVNNGETIKITAGTASDINAGEVKCLGTTASNITVVVPYTIPAGTTGVGNRTGTYEFECASATTFTQGANVYYNTTSKLATATTTDYLIGKSFGTTVAGDCKVLVGINC